MFAHPTSRQAATFQLHLGDRAAYRETCRRLLERFGGSSVSVFRERAAKAALLAPPPEGELERLTGLIDSALTPEAQAGLPAAFVQWFQLTKGMAEYRAGRYEQAVEWLLKPRGVLTPAGVATADLYLAMAYRRAGRAAEAAAALERATRAMDKSAPPAGGDRGIEALNWVVAELTRREAEQLLRARTPPATSQAPTAGDTP